MSRDWLCAILEPELVDSRLGAHELIAHLVLLIIGILNQDFAFGTLFVWVGSDVSNRSRCNSCECSAIAGQRADDIVDL